MKKLVLIFIILVIFNSSASAAEISGSAVSDGKKLSSLEVTLGRINGTTQSDTSMTGEVYSFAPLAETTTDKNGSYAFTDLNDGRYRVNLTYNGTIYGENLALQGKAVVDFNLSGKIEGFVLKANSTLEGIPLRLIDASGIEVMSALTSKNGKYSFNKVNVGSSYFVEATYEDVPYTKEATSSGSADFLVYGSTKDGDVISVNIDHIVFSRAPKGIKVDEFVEFTNTGDKVFFSKDRAWVGISTPEGATNFQTDVMECCLQREKDSAWIDPMKPIMPGETYKVEISYVFNPETSNNIFSKGMIYNTSYLTLLSEKNNGFGIDSKYAKKETVPNEGKEFEVLSFMSLPRGNLIDARITGYVPSKTSGSEDFNYLIPALALILIGAVSYPLIRSRMAKKTRRRFIKPTSVPASAYEPEETAVEDISPVDMVLENAAGKDITEMSFDELLAEKNAAFESIMNLDNEFDAGKIPEKEYKELKKEHKERATLIVKQLKEAALNLDLDQPLPVLEKTIAHVSDINVMEELLEREKEGENRDELKEIIEQRIEDIEQNE
ncbi:MAG: hypothetical protein WC568_03410 [Candidatus Methanoperedens sp.]